MPDLMQKQPTDSRSKWSKEGARLTQPRTLLLTGGKKGLTSWSMSSGTIEIITGRERRRRWSIEEKLRIVAETEEAGARVTEVAARRGVYPGLLFTWRRQVRDGLLAAPPAAALIPMRMLATETAPDRGVRYPADGERSRSVAVPPLRDATIEITLANGCRLRVDQQIDVRALRRIIGVLRG